MSTVLLHLPYFPNVYWLKQFITADKVVIEHCENFVKGSYRNRCEIAGPNGRQLLSIPVTGGRDHHQVYREVAISYESDWQKNHWQSIKAAYGSAPYFEHYDYKLKALFTEQGEFLFAHNLQVLNTVLKLLKLSADFALTETYEQVTAGINDLRKTKQIEECFLPPRYYQVFEERHGFMRNLSVLDLLFNLGPRSMDYLRDI